MKRLVFVLGSLLILPAFAEVAPAYYDDVNEYAEIDAVDADVVIDDATEENVSDTPKAVTARSVSNVGRVSGRMSSSRAMSNGVRTDSGISGRSVTGRAVASNSEGRARTAVSRSVGTRARVANNNAVTARSARVANTGNANAARASIVQSDTVNKPLYNGSRVSVSSRVPAIRMSTVSTGTSTSSVSASTATTAADTVSNMDELAQLTDYCKAQYTQCMDNFCNVLDDEQGRCSCSVNIKNYAKTEDALKQATEDLQDVAQKIQYIGLSAEDVETLFTQTEAELTMQSKQDNTQMKNDLDKIKKLIVGVKSGTATSTETGIGIDLSGLLDFNISSSGFDLASLFGGTGSANTASISNQRGEQLYKTAAARCKSAVLTSCTAQGVDASIITNAYDVEIDKQCIAYERNLTEQNSRMVSTVRNAKSVLQKARLMVAQQKNQYDMRGCVNALDSCMQDDFVCGSDYESCLDPTGKFIVNGAIVVGSQPGESGGVYSSSTSDAADANTLYAVWNYDSNRTAWNGNGTLSGYIEKTVTGSAPKSADQSTLSGYLQYKIGYNDNNGKNYGMCISVLNKCQNYTYDKNGKYKPDNDVIKEYLARTLTQIKSRQDEILAEYAESCVADVTSCLNQNNYDITQPTTYPKNGVAIRACLSMVKTCMSVNAVEGSVAGTQVSVEEWIAKINNTTTSSMEPNPGTAITLNFTNGGHGSIGSPVPSPSCTYNSSTFNLPTMDNVSGYTFNGWLVDGVLYPNAATGLSCTRSVLGNSVSSGTVTITGSWTANN